MWFSIDRMIEFNCPRTLFWRPTARCFDLDAYGICPLSLKGSGRQHQDATPSKKMRLHVTTFRPKYPSQFYGKAGIFWTEIHAALITYPCITLYQHGL